MAKVIDQSKAIYGLDQFGEIAVELKQKLPKYVLHAVGKGLYEEGKTFLKDIFQPHIKKVFGTDSKLVKHAFHVYTTGESLDTLTLGLFSNWMAAGIYEKGGTIRPSNGKWLTFPINPKAYTSQGRVKRSWRDASNPQKFDSSLFDGLISIKTRGGIMLAKPVSGREKLEPMFMLVRATHRAPVLNFFSSFERFAGAGGGNLQGAVNGALKAFARDA